AGGEASTSKRRRRNAARFDLNRKPGYGVPRPAPSTNQSAPGRRPEPAIRASRVSRNVLFGSLGCILWHPHGFGNGDARPLWSSRKLWACVCDAAVTSLRVGLMRSHNWLADTIVRHTQASNANRYGGGPK